MDRSLTQPAPVRGAGLSSVQAIRKGVLAGGLGLLLVAVAFTGSHLFGVEAHERVEAVGKVLLFICVAGRVWCSLYIGGRKNAELVTSGPYSTVRNPLYVFSFIGAAGAGAQSGSLILAGFTLVLAVIVFAVVVGKEEATLERLHGDAYRRYRATTPRFIPNPLLWRTAGPLRPDARLVTRTLIDSLVFLLAIPICEGLEKVQSLGYLKALFNLP